MIKRMIIMLLIVGLLLGGVFWFIQFKTKMIKQFITAGGVPVQTVSTTTASAMDWTSGLESVGTVRAVQGVDVSSEVAGIVEQLYFHQGDNVKAGAPLLQLRDREEQSKLKSLASAAEIARITYNRDKALLRVHAISQQVVDNDKANLDIALAHTVEQQVLIAKKRILAPFDGQLGLRNVDLGQHLDVGAAIVTLQNLHKVYVDFYMPQQALATLKPLQQVTVKTDVYPEQDFPGEITVINPKVDEKTRNVQVRATLANPGHKLLPGLYVTVAIATNREQHFITLPRTAISFNPYGALVYRVENSGKDDKGNPKLLAKQVFVTTGETRGDQIAVTQGIQEGDTIITSGQIKLRNSSPVRVDNSVQPKNDAAPTPIDQ
ncbi:putative Acriflavin resistance protein E RND efflux membrane fusion protein [Crenothrix polyspora]|uniref:Putative Acriflavin resistance protein E RND efflux membrane fusion protein n=1 Tax=Crenothrix polyspora TaxID=360316 RepID=A0A1R4H1L2_9GAMM|nr:efflux RND transporter periplasmic adaptor subunit [Crenothrix polyspora]SJM90086.1 putative Acriflavin resistance protein E RND efflux membrane fusion protein [Crenothrix polyspora]